MNIGKLNHDSLRDYFKAGNCVRKSRSCRYSGSRNGRRGT